MEDNSVRLNKLLAERLGISRRGADRLIADGKVLVNGASAGLGARVCRGVDIVSSKGADIETTVPDYRYLLFHKPAGYISSRRPQGDTPTIYQALPARFSQLKPVGRLDKDSSGLLLLTDDGDFAHSMTHPAFQKQKVYFVTLDKPLQPLHQQMINDYGVTLEDGNSRLGVSTLADSPEAANYPPHTYRVEMHEGRNRQIRRTFAALGYEVARLHRTVFGRYQLGDLAAGKWKQTVK